MRVVIGCDQGIPAELLRDALTLGKALSTGGHTVAYLMGDPIALVDCSGSWIPDQLLQAPVLRSAPHLVMKRPAIDGFADAMAIAGFDNKQNLLTLAAVWQQQLDSLKPDAIVGLYSPILWLVGPGRCPTFAIGNGYALPPVLGTSFPRLSVESTPLASESTMLSNANAVLARSGKPSLASLSEIVTECRPILYGLPDFDPYLRFRRTSTAGFLGAQPKPAVPPAHQRLIAFLDVYCPGIEMIVLALAGLTEARVDVYLGGATSSMGRYLEQQPNVQVWREHGALLDEVISASGVVHHGHQDVAQRCMAAGRPQFLIPWTREQEVLGYSMGWMGLIWSKPSNVPIGEMAASLRDFMKDESLVVAAQHHAFQLAETGLDDALPLIIERIEASVRS